jgi:hypothetical protein
MRLTSRTLALLIVAVSMWRVWSVVHGPWYVVFCFVVPMILIWFPDQIDDMTFGTWDRGNQINVHTPAFLIVGFGWVILLLEAFVFCFPRGIARLM